MGIISRDATDQMPTEIDAAWLEEKIKPLSLSAWEDLWGDVRRHPLEAAMKDIAGLPQGTPDSVGERIMERAELGRELLLADPGPGNPGWRILLSPDGIGYFLMRSMRDVGMKCSLSQAKKLISLANWKEFIQPMLIANKLGDMFDSEVAVESQEEQDEKN